MQPLVAVIATHNRCDSLKRTLDALDRCGELDRLVVDNACTDATREMLQARGGLRVLAPGRNLGGAGGYEAGLRHAFSLGYQEFWCLDDDSPPEPDALRQLRSERARHPGQVLLGCNIHSLEGGLDPFWNPLGPYDPRRRSVRRGHPLEHLRADQTSCAVNVLPLAGMYFDRAFLERVGYPDGSLFHLFDDVDLCYRSWTAGVPVLLVLAARLRHPPLRRQRSWLLFKAWSTVIYSRSSFYYVARNRLRVDARYLRGPELALSAAEIAYDALVHVAARRDPGYLGELARAAWHAFRGRLGPRP